jgi:hypothetical protein
MNSQIEAWRVVQFGTNVYRLAQQKGSRLAKFCRPESFDGKAEFFDTIGQADAQEKLGRNVDTPNLNIAHSRRMLVSKTYDWGTLVDRTDKLENIHMPESNYAIAAKDGIGRKMDDVIISAALSASKYGEDGSSSQVLGNAQKVTAVASGALDYPNLQLLRKMKRVFDEAEVEGQRILVHRADFVESLLGVTAVTSADFNTIKALVQGEIDEFMGFKWVRSERLPLATTNDDSTYKYDTTTGAYNSGGTALAGTERSCLAFIGDGIIFGRRNNSSIAKIDERSDKSYSKQVYVAEDFGAVRMEEYKVVQGIYKPA